MCLQRHVVFSDPTLRLFRKISEPAYQWFLHSGFVSSPPRFMSPSPSCYARPKALSFPSRRKVHHGSAVIRISKLGFSDWVSILRLAETPDAGYLASPAAWDCSFHFRSLGGIFTWLDTNDGDG